MLKAQEILEARERGKMDHAPNILTGFVALNGWCGFSLKEVEIIGETEKKYRIRAIGKTKIAGRDRWLNAGEETLIKKESVWDHCEICGGSKGGAPGNENRQNGKVVCDYCST